MRARSGDLGELPQQVLLAGAATGVAVVRATRPHDLAATDIAVLV